MNDYKTKAKLLLVTLSALVGLTAAISTNAQTKDNPPTTDSSELVEIVVTGSSIRGVEQPVGSNLITVGRDSIEKTDAQSTQQVLQSLPSISGLTGIAQGGYGSNEPSGAYQPSIHGLGGVFSNSTLVLIDGHRFPLAGTSGNVADPNFLPANALERVEVLPDGASSIYGSDAVAGVINFVTRQGFSGVQLTTQNGFGDEYGTSDVGALMGKIWDSGFAWFAYDYSYQSALAQSSRPYTWPDHAAQGGSNNNTFYCSPATVQPAGSSLIYAYPYTKGGVPSSDQSAAPCNSVAYSDLVPSVNKQSAMFKIEQQVNDRLTLSGDAVYSNRTNRQDISDGTVQATVYGPGSGMGGQINPFYEAPAGNTATSETVRLDMDQLLGGRAYALSQVETYDATGKAELQLSDTWRLTGSIMLGANTSTTTTYNAACVSCALLALNGTTNTKGSATQPSIIGTNITVLNPLLTTTNALDPFYPVGNNRTSAAILAGLTDGPSYASARHTIGQYNLKVDGDLIHLPAGDLKIAAGGEYLSYTERPSILESENIGPISEAAYSSDTLEYERNVKSAFLEALIPITSPDMQLPLMRKIDVDLSGRYDDYSDFGSTVNPKFGVDWQVITGLKLRADIATSFVAPPLSAIGQNGVSASNAIGNLLGPFVVPLASYPQAKLIPGCAGSTAFCLLNTNVQGVVISGANANLKASSGHTWTFGVDYTIPDLTSSLTYWHNELTDGVTSPIPSLALGSPAWSNLLTIYPNGATPAQLAALSVNHKPSGVFPQTVYWSYNFAAENALNLTVEGIDMNVQWAHSFDGWRPTAGVAFTYLTHFDQNVGGPTFSVLNTSGYNSTFPSIRMQLRANMGVTIGPASLTATLNHTGSFTYWGNSAINPVITNAAGEPVGGGDRVDSYTTADLHASYQLDNFVPKPLEQLQVFLNVSNLFNKDPPFENSNVASNNSAPIGGYDPFEGNPIGRVISVGLRTKF